MSKPTFLEGIGVALVASLAGSVVFTALAPAFAGAAVLRLMVAGIGLGYVLYLLRRSRERVGRVSVVALWGVVATGLWLLHPPLSLYLVAHIGLIWLVRSLYFFASALSALADLALSGLSLAAGVWAAEHTGSLFLAIWCFFLLQALFVAIPQELRRKPLTRALDAGGDDRFERAHRVAEAAVRKLSTVN